MGLVKIPQSNYSVFGEHVESRLKTTRDIEEFKLLAHGFVRELGFSDFCYFKVMGENDFEISVTTIPETMFRAYAEHGIRPFDAMIEYLEASPEYVFQKNIFAHEFSSPYETERVKKNKMLKSIMESYSIYDSFAMPMHNRVGGCKEVTAMTLYCRGLSIADFGARVGEKLIELESLAHCFYKYGYKRNLFRALPSLTPDA